MKPSIEQFSNRVEAYVKYRPSYPGAVVDMLRSRCDLSVQSEIADIGSGTGIFAASLLNGGFRVYAVEPNDEMRAAAELRLSENPYFESRLGTAEKTGLSDHSIDLVTVAQAFHWFRPGPTKFEFERVLRPGGWVALLWNERKPDAPFQEAYSNLLREHSAEYRSSKHMNIDETAIREFFGAGSFDFFVLRNEQQLEFEELKGRMQSASYTPTPDRQEFVELMADLERAFDTYAVGGKVRFDYDTKLYLGKLSRPS